MNSASNVALLAAEQRREDEFDVPAEREWPILDDEAFRGLAGRYIEKIEPHTEADPAGILVQFLVMVGNVIGRGPHFTVEADQHHLNLFTVLVGESAKGRKGVSAGQAKRLLEASDPDWARGRIEHGLSSGEGLIWAVRDPIEKNEPIRENGNLTGAFETVVTEEGVDDKRLLILEGEFASPLRVMKRSGNTLSPVIRTAWDSGHLSSLTKNSPARSTEAHISIIGHITKAELIRYLESTEAANGFGNRFLWCCVRRSKCLPEGGRGDTLDFTRELEAVQSAISFARGIGEMRRDQEARNVWADVYPELSSGKPGLLGSMIGRAEAQAMRIACLYALLDESAVVRAEHLMAALALWSYCESSARWIFGDALGDPVADTILEALQDNPAGLTKSEIGQLFSGHRSKKELGRALATLRDVGLATSAETPTGGRPVERWELTQRSGEISEKSEERS